MGGSEGLRERHRSSESGEDMQMGGIGYRKLSCAREKEREIRKAFRFRCESSLLLRDRL